MNAGRILVATGQFAVSADCQRNADEIIELVQQAAVRGARVVHFCEGALSGYAPHDLPDYQDYPWPRLKAAAERVAVAAAACRLWVVLGSAHPLEPGSSGVGPKPHNSVYIINDQGQLLDRYDKRFCAGDDVTGELALYSPGDHPSVFVVDGVRCGVLVCHECRYPELYRAYKALGVDLVLHSFHAANQGEAELSGIKLEPENRAYNWADNLPGVVMPACLVGAAAANHLWLSGANSAAPYACWGSMQVRADGVIVGRLEPGERGLTWMDVDLNAPLYESTRLWRERAQAGQMYSGTLVDSERSRARQRF